MFSKTLRIVSILVVCALVLMLVTPALAARGDTILISLNDAGNQEMSPQYAPAFNPITSSDGQFVVFESGGSFINGDNNKKADIYMRDTINNTTALVSQDRDGTPANGESAAASISGNGRYVTFYSYASDLLSLQLDAQNNPTINPDTNGQADVFMRDTVTNTTVRVSVANGTTGYPTGQSNDGSYTNAISADGRYVAFYSFASNLVPGDVNGKSDVFVRDTVANTTKIVSIATDNTAANSNSYAPVISADGRYVAYYSFADTLVPGDLTPAQGGKTDVFLRDTVLNTTTRISIADGVNGAAGNDHSDYPSISSDGHYIAFVSGASNLVANDTNGERDIFVRDTVANTTTRVSVNSGGVQATNASYSTPSISADGNYIVFSSLADDLVSDDTNNVADIFVHDMSLGLTRRISVNTSLSEADGPSYNPSISSDGNFVAFNSIATNLVDSDANGDLSDIFLYDKTFSSDVTGPTVTINQAVGQADPTSATTINFTAVFDEPIKLATFLGSDISFTGTSPGDVAGSTTATITEISPNDGTTFNIAATGLSGNLSGDGTVVASMLANKIADRAGNPNSASTSTDNTVTYQDVTPPSVTISAAKPSPINGPFTARVKFNEPVTGFTLSDVVLTNGTATNFAGSGYLYTFTFTPTVNGPLTIDVPAAVAKDTVLLDNLAAPQFSYVYDSIPPTTSIDSHPPSIDTNYAPDFVFSGSDTAPGTVASFMCKIDTDFYDICELPFTTYDLLDGGHSFSVYAVDAASNFDASPAVYTWTIDTLPPTVVSSTLTDANPTSLLNAHFTVTFSEAVTGVDVTDFSLTTTGVVGASIVSVSGSGATRTVTVSTGTGNGTIHLNVLDNNSIVDLVSHSLNGAFSTGSTYTISKIKTFYSAGSTDGWVLESGETTGLGGSLNRTSTTFTVGDSAAKQQYVGILSFATGAGMPDTAVITSLILKLKRNALVGTISPMTALQGIMADIKKGFFGTSSSLQTMDFNAKPGRSYGPYKPSLKGGWYGLNLTSGKAYVNKLASAGGLTQIRVRFKLDDNNDLIANGFKLYSGNAPASSRPQLIITYYVP